MTHSTPLLLIGLSTLFTLVGCRGDDASGPPAVRYGDSICVECGMIISDERFATATIVQGDRGNEPLLFDDFNCQMIFEAKHTDLIVTDRWSHDHSSSEWLHMADAWYVKSDKLHTPMASHIAAFSTREAAEAFASPLEGETLDFQSLWIFE